MPVQRRQHLAETGREPYYKDEWLHKPLDSKGAFYNDNESDNDDESGNGKNEQQQLQRGFANSCYKILIFLQKLINDFAVSKQCSRTLLLAEDGSHSQGNQNHIFKKGTTFFNRSTQNMWHFYVMLHIILYTEYVWKALFLRNKNRFYLNSRSYSEINSFCSNKWALTTLTQ